MKKTGLARIEPGMLDIEKARDFLALCVSVDKAADFCDKSSAVDYYVRRTKAGLQSELHSAEIVTRARRRLGELLRELPKDKGGGSASKLTGTRKEPVNDAPPKLADLGVTKKESSVCQRLADVPARKFEAAVEGLKSKGQRPTTSLVVAASSPSVTKPPKTKPVQATVTPLRVVPDSDPDEGPDEWNEQVAIIDAMDAVGRIVDAWPTGRSMAFLISELRTYADRLERREGRS